MNEDDPRDAGMNDTGPGTMLVCIDASGTTLIVQGAYYELEGVYEDNGADWWVIVGVARDRPFETRGMRPARFRRIDRGNRGGRQLLAPQSAPRC